MEYDVNKSIAKINELLKSDFDKLFFNMRIANTALYDSSIQSVFDCKENIELSEKIKEYCEIYGMDFNVVSSYFRVLVALSAFNP